MTDTIAPDRPAGITFSRRLIFVVISLIVILGVGVVCFKLGVNTRNRDVTGLQESVKRLQEDNKGLSVAKKKLEDDLEALQKKLASMQATLDAIMPSPNVYEITQNQSRIVPYGHMTIGLVGAPTSQNVDLNINGKQYTATSGEVIRVPIQQSATCRVEVISLDGFRYQGSVEVSAVCVDTQQ